MSGNTPQLFLRGFVSLIVWVKWNMTSCKILKRPTEYLPAVNCSADSNIKTLHSMALATTSIAQYGID